MIFKKVTALNWDYKTMSIVKRYENNPILSAKDIPYDAKYVFNSSVIKDNGEYIMIFRNDYENQAGKGRNFGLARSKNGIDFVVDPKPIIQFTEETGSGYDPRMVKIDDIFYIVYTAVTSKGQRGAIVKTKDFIDFETVSLGLPETRNTVLFPEKINGKFYKLERPFWELIDYYNQATGEWVGNFFNMWISESPDLVYWGNSECLLSVKDVPFANIKVGAGPTPLKTPYGWLLFYHAVDSDFSRGKNGVEEFWKHRYTFSVMLLDLENPKKVLGICKEPLVVPEVQYEIDGGFRNNVVFPCGNILEDDGTIKIYYGAADAVTCLAMTKLEDIMNLFK